MNDQERPVKKRFLTRSVEAGSYSILATIVLIVIAVVLNLIIGRLPGSWTSFDTTPTKMYSVGEQSKQIISNLKQDVNIYWIVTSGSEDSNLGNLLASYEGLNSHLHVEKKDPAVYPTFVQQYTTAELADNSLIITSPTDTRVVDYGDIFVYDYGSYMVDGSYTSEFYGEKQITSAINYVSNPDRPMVYITAGHGEKELSADLKEDLRGENMDVTTLNIVSNGGIPSDAKALIIVTPQTDFSREETELLQAYLERGGRLCCLTDYSDAQLPNLSALLRSYGLEYVNGIVIEARSEHYAWNYSYNIIPQISYLHDITHALQDSGYKVVMPLAQGILLHTEELPETTQAVSLLSTSSSSYAKTGGYDIQTFMKQSGDIDGPFSLSVAIRDYVNDMRLVSFTTTQMLDEQVNEYIGNANFDLFINAIDWLCDNETSISIRVHSMDANYLSISSRQANRMAVIMVGLIPLLFIAAGAMVVIRRRRGQ